VATVRYLHEASVCHRDLRPDNIIVSPSTFDIKLIDFNVAVTLKTPAPDYEDEILGSTGLREWSAPETKTQLFYSAKCDLWSLGCLLRFLLDHCRKDTDVELVSRGHCLVDGLLCVDNKTRYTFDIVQKSDFIL
jgi:serine/threonine protein kinase